MPSNKPVVLFLGDVGIRHYELPNGDKGEVAIIHNVLNHPHLGTAPWVQTSTIVQRNEDNTRIETRNTIYIKE